MRARCCRTPPCSRPPGSLIIHVVTRIYSYECCHHKLDGVFVTNVVRFSGVARDVGGADPERMTPLAAAELARELFASEPRVRVRVVQDRETLLEQYPLFAAVDRAAAATPRHRGRYCTYCSALCATRSKGILTNEARFIISGLNKGAE